MQRTTYLKNTRSLSSNNICQWSDIKSIPIWNKSSHIFIVCDYWQLRFPEFIFLVCFVLGQLLVQCCQMFCSNGKNGEMFEIWIVTEILTRCVPIVRNLMWKYIRSLSVCDRDAFFKRISICDSVWHARFVWILKFWIISAKWNVMSKIDVCVH